MAWYFSVLVIVFSIAFWFALSSLFYKQFFKRFYDIVLSFIAIIVLSPVLLVLAVLGRVKMKGSPFFLQERPGKKGKDGNERIFKLVKFRSMTEERDGEGNYLPDEVRLTRYGRILRASSLDELPELFNILKGDMSVIGPRPQLVRDMVFMTPEQRLRHTVRPGLSGLAQTRGRNAISWDDKLYTDLEYIQHVTLFGDVKIVFDTVKQVFFHQKGLKNDDVDEVAIVDDFGDYLLKAGRVSRDEYDKKQAEARRFLGM